MYQRILVATDDSPLSRDAVKAAVELAAAVGAELLALHVVPRYPTAFFEGAIALDADDVARVEQQWTEKGQVVVDAAVRQAEAAGVKARGLVASGDAPADAILSTARRNRADLIVMASHGRRGLSRVLLGSETQHVLTHGTTPVLVLR